MRRVASRELNFSELRRNFLELWIRLRERLMESALAQELVGLALLFLVIAKRDRSDTELERLVVACRRISTRVPRFVLKEVLKPFMGGESGRVWREHRIGWGRYLPEYDPTSANVTTSLLIKAPGPGREKGVLYVSFEYNWLRLAASPKAEVLFKDYFLVGASSWSPPDYSAMLSLNGLSYDPMFLGVSNMADMRNYEILEPIIRAVPLMACDWINPDYYAPRHFADRDIDILMVANFSEFKRHRVLFKALSRMRRDIRVTLIGIPVPGRDENVLRQEARAYGARQDLEILSNVPADTVSSYQCRAKTSLIMTLREGSCVAVTESLFAGSPVGMLRHAHIGAKAHINPETGILLSESKLDFQLSGFLERSETYGPRKWALDHITCNHSSGKLNRILREYSIQSRRAWTRDIAPLCWRYVPSHVHASDAESLASAVATLEYEYGIKLEQFRYRRKNGVVDI